MSVSKIHKNVKIKRTFKQTSICKGQIFEATFFLLFLQFLFFFPFPMSTVKCHNFHNESKFSNTNICHMSRDLMLHIGVECSTQFRSLFTKCIYYCWHQAKKLNWTDLSHTEDCTGTSAPASPSLPAAIGNRIRGHSLRLVKGYGWQLM